MFVSRSSVQLIQIRRVEILSILQCINMILWVIDVHVSTDIKQTCLTVFILISILTSDVVCLLLLA